MYHVARSAWALLAEIMGSRGGPDLSSDRSLWPDRSDLGGTNDQPLPQRMPAVATGDSEDDEGERSLYLLDPRTKFSHRRP